MCLPRLILWHPTGVTLAVVLAVLACRSAIAQDSCGVDSIVISGAVADSSALVYFGRGQGQVITVADTIVQSVTVWRTPQPAVYKLPLQLFITRVNEEGRPILPAPLLEGPQIDMSTGDGIHPVAVHFELDPPFHLPGPGTYFFAIKEATCIGVLSLLADSRDPYPNGSIWQTFPNVDCSFLGGGVSLFTPDFDLAIHVAYCASATQTSSRSWGSVKTIYR
jgi:hypothetical protein